ncbi:IS66 family insertion sequence element accessory protein TnpB [Clostridium sp. 19966]|uniref:IS66 family insertion sequence element accessory protein TnpA n=1 Tax=Clostridium sp. 19966 TaxID=2768166 RepID=UPI0028E02D9E|nr:IS66 family insertion sequence element accessory protein TnpB [Clostridium sp. 19966]MDT8719721.1 IS66 family insertion sequence element accessory protein TnpB [Clostridium sp. 19966]
MDTRKISQDYRMNKWINLIQECHDSGDGIRAWCRNNGIKTNSYYYWLRKIRVAACKALPSSSNQQQIVPIEMPKVVEIHNTASNTLIESTLRFLKNDR